MAINEKRGGIYAIRNLVTQKKYVGSAVCISKRVGQHLRLLNAGKHHSIKLQRSWIKHGAAAFEFVVLAIVDDPTMLLPAEQSWIDFLDVVSCGYNVAPRAGSLLGVKQTEETKRKRSVALTGRKNTPEHIAATRAGLLGRKMTPEQCRKMRDAKLGKTRTPHSAETKAKMSAASKGKPKSVEHRTALSRAKTGSKQSLEHVANRFASIRRKAAQRISPAV